MQGDIVGLPSVVAGSIRAEVWLCKRSVEPVVKTLAAGHKSHAMTPFLPVAAVQVKPKLRWPMGIVNEPFGKGQIARPRYWGRHVGIRLASLGRLRLLGDLILLGCLLLVGCGIGGGVRPTSVCGGVCPSTSLVGRHILSESERHLSERASERHKERFLPSGVEN